MMFYVDCIIVVFDGSDNSKKVLQIVIDFVKIVNVVIIVVYLYDMKDIQIIIDLLRFVVGVSYIGGGMISVFDLLILDVVLFELMIYEDCMEEVIVEVRMMLNDQQVDGSIDILEGDLVELIIEYVNCIFVDMIVIGSRD